MSESKTCKHCSQTFSLDNFYRHGTNKDGLMNVCKACHNKRCRIIEKNNPERRKAYWNKYYKANPEKYRAIAKRYREANPEKVRAVFKKWRESSPDIDRIRHHRRRAHKESVQTFKVTLKEIARMRSQACFYCGSREKICIDHVVPLSRGGNNSIGNYLPACLRCNSSKKNKTIMEWKKVRGW